MEYNLHAKHTLVLTPAFLGITPDSGNTVRSVQMYVAGSAALCHQTPVMKIHVFSLKHVWP